MENAIKYQTKGYIYDNQMTLFGKGEIVGFGKGDFYIKEIDRIRANNIIDKNHYSHKHYNLSYIHLGVFINDAIVGVLQFGYAMNPASGNSIVPGTANNEYLELNRMWLDDIAPRNSESMAISYSIKYIKRKLPMVGWIQSFADERCGGLGIVYQACSFGYYGEHNNIFWELDGVVYHNIEMTVTENADRYSDTSKYLQDNKHRAKKLLLRQFRYLKFINSKLKDRCALRELPYPKHYNND
jgi:adenine modification enzyme